MARPQGFLPSGIHNAKGYAMYDVELALSEISLLYGYPVLQHKAGVIMLIEVLCLSLFYFTIRNIVVDRWTLMRYKDWGTKRTIGSLLC